MDNYEEIYAIGGGGCGQVHLVHQNNTAQFLAIKKVTVRGRDCRQALKEVAILAKLNHPNIVSYVGSFQEKGCLHIVMNFCFGGDLLEKIKQKRKQTDTSLRKFARNEISNILQQLCLALEYVHKQNIMHRDIKPQNIFFTLENSLKLGDFGVSKILSSSQDLANTPFVGTFKYSAPELFARQSYSKRCDMWSLGCVLYELITLKRPFDEGGFDALVQKISNANYDPLPADVDSDLRNLIVDLIQKEESKRPTATDVLNRLDDSTSSNVTERICIRLQSLIKEVEDDSTSYNLKPTADSEVHTGDELADIDNTFQANDKKKKDDSTSNNVTRRICVRLRSLIKEIGNNATSTSVTGRIYLVLQSFIAAIEDDSTSNNLKPTADSEVHTGEELADIDNTFQANDKKKKDNSTSIYVTGRICILLQNLIKDIEAYQSSVTETRTKRVSVSHQIDDEMMPRRDDD